MASLRRRLRPAAAASALSGFDSRFVSGLRDRRFHRRASAILPARHNPCRGYDSDGVDAERVTLHLVLMGCTVRLSTDSSYHHAAGDSSCRPPTMITLTGRRLASPKLPPALRRKPLRRAREPLSLGKSHVDPRLDPDARPRYHYVAQLLSWSPGGGTHPFTLSSILNRKLKLWALPYEALARARQCCLMGPESQSRRY
jgi:hypothetical protein